MFNLSVCMIVKNEENVLNRILKCAKKFADEIIIEEVKKNDIFKPKENEGNSTRKNTKKTGVQ